MSPIGPVSSRTLIAYVEDRPAVLARVVSLLRRRGYSIDSLTVGPTQEQAVSQVTLVVRIDEDGARRLMANLWKLVEIVDVEDVTSAPAVLRELALVRLRASDEARAAVKKLGGSARVLEDDRQGSLALEVTGTRPEIDAAVEALRPVGILRLVRTGAVAVSAGEAGARGAPAGSAGRAAGGAA